MGTITAKDADVPDETVVDVGHEHRHIHIDAAIKKQRCHVGGLEAVRGGASPPVAREVPVAGGMDAWETAGLPKERGGHAEKNGA